MLALLGRRSGRPIRVRRRLWVVTPAMVKGGTALMCGAAATTVAVAAVAAAAVEAEAIVVAVGGRRLLVCCRKRKTRFWRLRRRWTGQSIGDVFPLPLLQELAETMKGFAVSSAPDMKWLYGKGRSIVNAVCRDDGTSDGDDGVEMGVLSAAKPAMGESERRGYASA